MQAARSYRLTNMVLVPLALLIAGCSSMSKHECLAVDWRTIGYEDGVAGYPGDRIGQHRKACAKHGVRPDLELYQTGREKGLHEYCHPANGYRLGVRGGSYSGVCPADLEPEFISSFEAGQQLYTLESRVRNTDAQLNARHRELDRVQRAIASNSAAVLNKDLTDEDRAEALVHTANLAERVGRLKEEIRQLEADRVRYERDLDEYTAGNPPIT